MSKRHKDLVPGTRVSWRVIGPERSIMQAGIINEYVLRGHPHVVVKRDDGIIIRVSADRVTIQKVTEPVVVKSNLKKG